MAGFAYVLLWRLCMHALVAKRRGFNTDCAELAGEGGHRDKSHLLASYILLNAKSGGLQRRA